MTSQSTIIAHFNYSFLLTLTLKTMTLLLVPTWSKFGPNMVKIPKPYILPLGLWSGIGTSTILPWMEVCEKFSKRPLCSWMSNQLWKIIYELQWSCGHLAGEFSVLWEQHVTFQNQTWRSLVVRAQSQLSCIFWCNPLSIHLSDIINRSSINISCTRGWPSLRFRLPKKH